MSESSISRRAAYTAIEIFVARKFVRRFLSFLFYLLSVHIPLLNERKMFVGIVKFVFPSPPFLSLSFFPLFFALILFNLAR